MPAADVSAPDAAADLALLVPAAAEAGRIALGFFKRDQEVWMKAGKSPVSETDFAVDLFLRETLLAARPDYGWLSEETEDSPARLAARRTFVVDPIDGTRAFLAGRDVWCVSIAVVEDGEPLAAALECPAKTESYQATRGGGSFLNGGRLAVRSAGEPFTVAGPRQLIDATPRDWHRRLTTVPYIPSLAYRLAMVAAGDLDASYVRANSHDWDLAAADLMVREAGGQVLDRAGEPLRYAGEHVRRNVLAAGSGPLLRVMAEVIARFDG